ncbi:MAG: peptide chain release factor N(5)-glutamine methyltransferase [Holosporales bacterium]|jgi:release factor glutamine methyltransferase|nr:peptide chain release factor N(5)-glutamine methyltransferase [Holosporales bacterium]
MITLTKSELRALGNFYHVTDKELLILFSSILKKTYSETFFEKSFKISENDFKILKSHLSRRQKMEPISKIIQQKEFYGITYKTNAYTLDPRPETELIIDLFRRHYKDINLNLKILDLGCGTGCIGLTILTLYRNIFCEFVDISPEALNIAVENANNLRLSKRCLFTISDWFSQIDGKYDVILSNPPYISTDYKLEKEVLFDPSIALFAENNGIESIQKIISEAKNFLTSNGMLFMEIGFDQMERVKNIKTKLKIIEIAKDFGGIYRGAVFENA